MAALPGGCAGAPHSGAATPSTFRLEYPPGGRTASAAERARPIAPRRGALQKPDCTTAEHKRPTANTVYSKESDECWRFLVGYWIFALFRLSDSQGANGRYYGLAGAVRGSGKVLEKRAAQRRGYTNRLTSRPHPATEARRPPVWKPACPKSPVLYSTPLRAGRR